MNKVSVLVEGYAHPGKDGVYVASPTTSLIQSENKIILVDPGTNAKKLLEALNEKKLKVDDVYSIYLSHYHPDHVLNIRLFPKADIYDGETIWKKDEEYLHNGKLPISGIEIIKTPGHSVEHTSLLVETEKGTVCIAADIFWWEDGKQKSDNFDELMNFADPFAIDTVVLRKSRELVLNKADWIIPGHGKMFKNPKKT